MEHHEVKDYRSLHKGQTIWYVHGLGNASFIRSGVIKDIGLYPEFFPETSMSGHSDNLGVILFSEEGLFDYIFASDFGCEPDKEPYNHHKVFVYEEDAEAYLKWVKENTTFRPNIWNEDGDPYYGGYDDYDYNPPYDYGLGSEYDDGSYESD